VHVSPAADVRLLPPLALPERYRTAQLRQIGQADIAAVTILYCEQFREAAAHGLAPVFLGRVRTWKTYAAAAIARYVWHHERVAVDFVACPAEFTRFERRRFDPATDQELARLAATPFVVLDDFPLVAPNSYAAQLLVELVTRRFDATLPTLFTGNILMAPDDTSEVDARYGPQFGRRLYEMGRGYVVVVT
jgi:DNA replication protein DnaC